MRDRRFPERMLYGLIEAPPHFHLRGVYAMSVATYQRLGVTVYTDKQCNLLPTQLASQETKSIGKFSFDPPCVKCALSCAPSGNFAKTGVIEVHDLRWCQRLASR